MPIPVEPCKAEAALRSPGEGGALIVLDAGPEGAADAEAAIGVEHGGAVEHPVAEVADDAGTVAERDLTESGLKSVSQSQ